jgi:hypothetical protein
MTLLQGGLQHTLVSDCSGHSCTDCRRHCCNLVWSQERARQSGTDKDCGRSDYGVDCGSLPCMAKHAVLQC